MAVRLIVIVLLVHGRKFVRNADTELDIALRDIGNGIPCIEDPSVQLVGSRIDLDVRRNGRSGDSGPIEGYRLRFLAERALDRVAVSDILAGFQVSPESVFLAVIQKNIGNGLHLTGTCQCQNRTVLMHVLNGRIAFQIPADAAGRV